MGASCTATLDLAAQTLTFEHRGWGVHTDPRALTCGEDPGPFADRVRAAVAAATPVAPDVIEAAAEEVYDATDAKQAPTVPARVATGIGRGLIHALLNNW